MRIVKSCDVAGKKIELNSSMFLCFITIMLILVSCQQPTPPLPYGPVPSESHMRWQNVEYQGLICLGLNTYTGQEWGYGDISPEVFNPSNLDTDQWARVAKESGMNGLILVAKHHDGFCLWPSKTTDYTVAASPWKNGKGDVLGDLAKSCKKYGLELGVYISPWDRNHAEYGRPAYVEAFHEQWREVLEYSDDIYEFWIDGANGGTGYYGGAREKRTIEKDYYQYPKIAKELKEKHPGAVFFGNLQGVNSDIVRWGGTEQGTGSATNWSSYNVPNTNREIMKTGVKNGKYWMPVEGNTTLLYPKKWYYNKKSKPRNLQDFVNLYYTTIGQNATFCLGLAPGPDGLLPKRDVEAMLAQKRQIDKDFAENLTKDIKISASNHRGRTFIPENSIEGETSSYWASEDGVQKAEIVLDFGRETTFNRLLLQEYIRLGQRVHRFLLEVDDEGMWKEVAEGTTIGYKRILRFENVKATRARITLETDAPCLTLSNVEIYNARPIIVEPSLMQYKDGMVSIEVNKGQSAFYAIGSSPTEKHYKKYTKPFPLHSGGWVTAYALNEASNQKSDTVSTLFGIAKSKWKIQTASNKKSIAQMVDGNPETFWVSDLSEDSFVTIALNEKLVINGFSYVPPLTELQGVMFEYELYTSLDGKKWGKPISKGEFSNIENNPIPQILKFDKSVEASFLKLVPVSTIGNGNKVSVAEIDVFVEE